MDTKLPEIMGTYPDTSVPASISAGDGMARRDYLDVIFRRRRVIVAVFAVIMALGAIYGFTRKPVYQATTKLVVVSKENSSATPDDAILGSLQELTAGRNVQTQMEIIDSPDLLDDAFNGLGKLHPKWPTQAFHVEPNDEQALPKWAYSIENKHDTDVITVKVWSYVPEAARDLANKIATTYLDRDQRRNQMEDEKGRVYIAKARRLSQDRLDAATKALAAYQNQTGLVNPDETADAEAQRMADLETGYEVARSANDQSLARLSSLKGRMQIVNPNEDFAKELTQNPVYAQIYANIATLASQRSQYVPEYTKNAPELKDLDQSIKLEQARLAKTASDIITKRVTQRNPTADALEQAYALEVANQATTSIEEQRAQQDLAAAQAKMDRLPATQRQLFLRQEQVDVQKNIYEMLSQQYFQLQIKENSVLPNGLIASMARIPHKPVSPVIPEILVITALVGMLAAVGAAYGLESLDIRIRDPKLAERITRLTVLSAVPAINPSSIESDSRPLIGRLKQSEHGFLESYRILRNNIRFAAPDRELKVIGITSAGRAEGKSTTSANLAISMALDGNRVLLVDADLRKPSVHTTIGVSRDVGLTSVVAGILSLEEAIQKTEFEGVHALASGPLPPNPSEFLNTARCRAVFAEAKDLYDIVIVDSPPCAGLSDVQVISTLVQGLVLVIALDITNRPQLMSTVSMLRQAGAPLIGTLLNRLEVRPAYRYYYPAYYYNYYYYGYGEAEDDSKGKRKSSKKKKGDDNKPAKLN